MAPPGSDASPRKANLFIVGAPKCGTTAWTEYLRTHPHVYFPDRKEDCYFATDLPRFRFIHSEAEYAKLFKDAGNAPMVGESSAMYLFSKDAAAGIHAYNPEARILIFLRDQEDYLPSLHNQFLWEFSEEIRDFELAWKLSGHRDPRTIPATCLEPSTLDYAAMGRFDEQVARYLDLFGRPQVHVLWFRDWMSDPRSAYLGILDFLGVPDDGRTDFPAINTGVTYRSRSMVRFLYHPSERARKVVRSIKQMIGITAEAQRRAVEFMVRLLSARGYRKRMSDALRPEIRNYYAEDNRRLAARLSGALL